MKVPVCRSFLALVLAVSLSFPAPALAYAADEQAEPSQDVVESVEDEGLANPVGGDASTTDGSEEGEPSAQEGTAEPEDHPNADTPISEGDDNNSGTAANILSESSEPLATSEPVNESRDDCVAGELIVVYDNAGVSTRSRGIDGSDELEKLGASVVEEVSPATGDTGTVVVAQTPQGMTVDESMALLAEAPGIASVQPNFLYRLIDGVEESSDSDDAEPLSLGNTAVNDPLCNDSTTYKRNQYYLYNSKTVEAWERAQSEGTVTVAVLDTGCRLDHEDLAGTLDIEHAYDIVNDVPLSSSPVSNGDAMGHGTHVCGIVGAQANNGKGMAGASYNAKVLPIKVFNDKSSASEANATTADIVKAYTYLSDLVDAGSLKDLRVINLSLGYYPKNENSFDVALEQAISTLRTNYNVLTVCAGGNGDSVSTPYTERSLPSDFDECLAVTSLDRDGGNTVWSDYNEFKDISAPGCFITSASYADPSGYRELSGTSMASPLVAGIAALMWAAAPDLSVDDVVNALEATADPVVDAENDRSAVSGSHGAVNARAAIDMVAPQQAADQKTLKATSKNLVLLVRFAGDTVGDGETGFNEPYPYKPSMTQWQYLKYLFNGDDPDGYVKNSLRSYIETVSGGSHLVASDFPQSKADGKTVAYLTLPKTYAQYTAGGGNADYNIVSDAVNLFNKTYPDYDASSLDVNTDGFIDNLLIVPSMSSAASQGDPLWPHKADAHGWNLSVGTSGVDMAVGAYNIVDSKHLDIGTLAHEYLHTLGARDYYRQSISGDPVSMWDVMGAADTPRSWPLAYTRQSLGWTTIPEKREAGTFTLHAPGTGQDQAIVIRSPLNDTEYFIAEYRKKGDSKDISALDSFIGGSGLIVYRINPTYAQEGNVAGNDLVYVFRPGETGVRDAAGDILNAQITAPGFAGGKRTAIGSVDMGKGIVDGALCFSDGTNSGITLKATAQTDDSITFELMYPDYGNMDLWDTVSNADGSGSTFGSDGGGIQLVTDGEKTYSLLQQNVTTWSVRCYDGTNWKDLGIAGSGLYEGRLAAAGGEVYFLAADFSASENGIVLKKLEGSSWKEIARLYTGNPEVYMNGSQLCVIGTDVYVAAADSYENLTLYRYDGSGLRAVDAKLPPLHYSLWSLFDINGHPAIACGDFIANKSYVYEFVGGSWIERRTLEGFRSFYDATHDGSDTYLYLHGDDWTAPCLVVFDADGNYERTVKLRQFAGYSTIGNLTASDGHLYLSLIAHDDALGPVRVYEASVGDLETWTQLGHDAYTPSINVSSTIAGDSILVGAVNATGRFAAVKSHDLKRDKMALSLTMQPHPALTYGYRTNNAVTVTVRNDSNRTLRNLVPLLLKGSSQFELGMLSSSQLAPGETATFSCTTKLGLAVGSYDGRLKVVSGQDATPLALADFKREVTAVDISSGELFEKFPEVKGVAVRTYNTKPQTLVRGWIVRVGETTLGADDVELSYENNVNAGSPDSPLPPTVKVSAKSQNCRGAFDVPFTIKQLDLARGSLFEMGAMQPGIASRTYTGKPQTLANGWTVRVDLIEVGADDVALSYENNVNAATKTSVLSPQVTARPRSGNVKGSRTYAFTINPALLATARLIENTSVVQSLFTRTYDGKAQELTDGWVMKLGDMTLDSAKLKASYKNNVNASSASLQDSPRLSIVSSDPNFTGSYEKRFSIKQLDLSGGRLFEKGASSPGLADRRYTGSPQTLSDGWFVKAGNVLLGSNDVTLFYTNNVESAQATSSRPPTVTVSPKSRNVLGSFTEKFTIGFAKPLAEGTYVIQSAAPGGGVLDIARGSKADGGNVQVYRSNMSQAQRFRVTFDENTGYYTIVSMGSGKALDVSGGKKKAGTNVAQYRSNGTKAQKWKVEKTSGGTYRILSALGSNLALDVRGGKAKNGANVNVWTANGTKAQSFRFLATPPKVNGGKTVEDGLYAIRCASSRGFALDIAGGSSSNGANLQLWTANGTNAQTFKVTYGSDGFYSIVCVDSGKALDVDAGNVVSGTNVQQWSRSSSSANQRWAIRNNADGTISFVSKANGLALDVQNGGFKKGANVWTYVANGSAAQKFTLQRVSHVKPLAEGTYVIQSAAPGGGVLDIARGSKADGGNVQVYRSNGSQAQCFRVTFDKDTGYYTIVNAGSGKALDVSGGKKKAGTNVAQYRLNGTKAQKWKVEKASDGTYRVLSALGSNLTLDVRGGKAKNGANVNVWTANGTKAQSFRFSAV